MYQNPENGLFYYDEAFTNLVNGFVEGCCYENGDIRTACDQGGGWTGWCVDTFYYLSNPTTLPQNGTGWDSLSSAYYVGGNPTTLPESGTGIWIDKYYISGVLATGWYNEIYYINGVQTTLPQSGTGVWQNLLYNAGILFTGIFQGKRYANGILQNGIIVYRKTASTPWIKQGDRLTKTFPSGLCLIQQTYVAPKNLANYNAFVEGAAIADAQPCIDGAYIFPAPDYQDTGDGFMRCTVTAYGRWKTEPYVRRQKRKLELFVHGTIENMPSPGIIDGVPIGPIDVYFDPNKTKEVIADDIVLSFVMPPNVDLPLTPPSSLSRLYKINGEIFPQLIDVAYLTEFFGNYLFWRRPYTTFLGQVTITPEEFESNSNSFAPQQSGISLNLTRCESVEYGHFSEYTASFEATGTTFTKEPLRFRKK